MAYLILKDRVTLASGIGAATALTGVILVVLQPGTRADFTGIALTVAGVGACALYTVRSSKILVDASSLSIVLLQQAAALVFALALLAGSFVLGDPSAVSQVSAIGWLSAGAAGVLYYAVAFWFYVTGLRGCRPAFVGMFMNLIPVFGLAASYLFIGERMAPRQWLGVTLVLAAVIAIARFQVSPSSATVRPLPRTGPGSTAISGCRPPRRPPVLRRFGEGPVPLPRTLRRDAQLHTDPLPREPSATGRTNRVGNLTLATSAGQRSPTQRVLGYIDLVARRGLIVLEALRQLVGMVEDVLNRSGHRHHLRNWSVATMS